MSDYYKQFRDTEHKELRAAIRNAFFTPSRVAGVEAGWAKQAGMTPEEFINAEIDGRLASGWGEAFQVFRANHGRYPEHGETDQAAEEHRRAGNQ